MGVIHPGVMRLRASRSSGSCAVRDHYHCLLVRLEGGKAIFNTVHADLHIV